jgi:diacylglycerol kinase (ATP)
VSDLARDAVAGGAELVVAVGGDGTLSETVDGILRAGRPVDLATLPIGTGMDFVRTYGIPRRFEDAVRVAAGGRVREIDAGRVTYRAWSGDTAVRHFANVSSVGMSGAVAQRANTMSKALGGRATFFYSLVRVFFGWDNSEVTVEVEGETRRGRMHDVVVANGQWHGGGMWLAPEADPADGLFDVLLIGDITKPDFVRSALRIYRGTHLTHPKVDLLRSAWVEVDATDPLPIELDGEQPGTTPARFELLPRALRLRVPAESA